MVNAEVDAGEAVSTTGDEGRALDGPSVGAVGAQAARTPTRDTVATSEQARPGDEHFRIIGIPTPARDIGFPRSAEQRAGLAAPGSTGRVASPR
jgi:hypothetical protein